MTTKRTGLSIACLHRNKYIFLIEYSTNSISVNLLTVILVEMSHLARLIPSVELDIRLQNSRFFASKVAEKDEN